MTAEEKAKEVYIRCFDDDFKYPEVLNALRICAEESQREDYIAKLVQSDIDKFNKISFLSSKVQVLQKRNIEAKEIIREFVEWANWQGNSKCPSFKSIQDKAEAFLKE